MHWKRLNLTLSQGNVSYVLVSLLWEYTHILKTCMLHFHIVNVDDGKTSSDSNVILPAVLVPLLLLVLVIFVSVAIIVTVVYINRRKNTKHNQYSIDNPAVPQSDQH